MPRPGFPPTPASSTDIRGKENARLSILETSFTLPPPAIVAAAGNRESSTSAKANSDSSYHPASPTSPRPIYGENGRSSGVRQVQSIGTRSDVSLPPPPTRSRKIIQMKPGSQQNQETKASTATLTSKALGKKGAPASAATTSAKKHPSSTSVAGRKIARKTAHSLIERRRRSKMNDEFGVLKDMVPACRGQEMHKLAILQASIDYLRYLEQCVAELHAANNSLPSPFPNQNQKSVPRSHSPNLSVLDEDEDEESEDDDEDMPMEEIQTKQALPSSATSNSSPTASTAQNSSYQQYALPHTSTTTTTLPSPLFMHQSSENTNPYTHKTQLYLETSESKTTSPTLLSEGMRDADHEATAALLMLNADRRDAMDTRNSGRGMSVQDLLSA